MRKELNEIKFELYYIVQNLIHYSIPYLAPYSRNNIFNLRKEWYILLSADFFTNLYNNNFAFTLFLIKFSLTSNFFLFLLVSFFSIPSSSNKHKISTYNSSYPVKIIIFIPHHNEQRKKCGKVCTNELISFQFCLI